MKSVFGKNRTLDFSEASIVIRKPKIRNPKTLIVRVIIIVKQHPKDSISQDSVPLTDNGYVSYQILRKLKLYPKYRSYIYTTIFSINKAGLVNLRIYTVMIDSFKGT